MKARTPLATTDTEDNIKQKTDRKAAKNAAMVPMEKPAEGLAYAEEYDKKPYLTLGQLSTADVDADLKQCGLSGSPTKVKAVQNIVFKAKESKVLTASDADVEGVIQELLANHTFG